jgi:hypothetical protein
MSSCRCGRALHRRTHPGSRLRSSLFALCAFHLRYLCRRPQRVAQHIGRRWHPAAGGRAHRRDGTADSVHERHRVGVVQHRRATPEDYRGQYNGPDGGAVFWQDAKLGNPWPNAYTTDGTEPGLLPPSEKDKVTSFYLDMQAYNGISGMLLFEPTPADRRVMFLTGVFTTAAGPDGTAPPRLDFSSTRTSVPGGRSFTELSPLVDQLFYVGDGLTGEGVGSLQTFN